MSKRPSESKTLECIKLLKKALKAVLFNDSTDEELDKVMIVMQRLVVPPESHVITQGDSGDKFYVVQSGSLEVIVNAAVVGSLTTGDHFGELALIYDGILGVIQLKICSMITILTFVMSVSSSTCCHSARCD